MNFTKSRRDIWIVAVCTGISFAGDFMAQTSLTLTLQGRGASGIVIATLLVASMAPMVILAPIAGRIVDRYSSRTLLTVIGATQAAICAALAFVSSPVAVIALVALLAAGLGVTGPTLSALVPQMVDRDRMPRAQATIQTCRGLGVLVGPAVAGLLVGTFGQRVPLLIDAVSYLSIMLAGLLLRTVRRGAPLRLDAATGRVAGGFALVRRDPLLVGALVLISAGIAAISVDNVGEVFLIRGSLHGSAAAYGLLATLWAAMAIVGTWLFGRRTPGDRGLVGTMAVVLAIFGVSMLVMAAVPNVLWLVPIFVVGGLANGAINLVIGVLLGRRVEPEARGRVGAVFGGIANAGTLFGLAGGGLLTQAFDPRTVYAIAGSVALAVIAVLVVPVLRAAFRAPAVVAPAPAVTVGS